jgi:hypothetical protein
VVNLPNGDIETFDEDGQWHVRVEGKGGLLASCDDKDTAAAYGMRVAKDREVEHIVRRLDGTIDERNIYGHDPRSVSR